MVTSRLRNRSATDEDMRMRAYEARIEIDAPPEAIWPALADVARWPDWDSGVRRVEGTAAPGAKVSLVTEASDRAFPVTVAELEPPRRMVFRGGMPLGLFRGVRTYTLDPGEGGRTAFAMREEYTGPLVALIFRSMPDLQPSFERFAAGLKARVEDGG
jgi:hypothetical protein